MSPAPSVAWDPQIKGALRSPGCCHPDNNSNWAESGGTGWCWALSHTPQSTNFPPPQISPVPPVPLQLFLFPVLPYICLSSESSLLPGLWLCCTSQPLCSALQGNPAPASSQERDWSCSTSHTEGREPQNTFQRKREKKHLSFFTGVIPFLNVKHFIQMSGLANLALLWQEGLFI